VGEEDGSRSRARCEEAPMNEPLRSFLAQHDRRLRRRERMLGVLMLSLFALFAALLSFGACTPASVPPVVAKAEADVCKLRADWLLAVAIDPSLAPSPGSLRARLEAAEDSMCAARSK
jgi:hypothetical protein